jgi:hypothetical protein
MLSTLTLTNQQHSNKRISFKLNGKGFTLFANDEGLLDCRLDDNTEMTEAAQIFIDNVLAGFVDHCVTELARRI